MYSFDIKVIVQEMKDASIINMRIQKVYQRNSEFRFKLHGGGRKDLIIKAGERIHLTRYPKPGPRNPSGLAMYLRKKLQNLKILDLRQINFDRIVEVDIGLDDTIYHLIAELFGEGNLILTDPEYEILTSWKKHHKREIYVGDHYEFPESNDIFTGFELEETDREIVRVLASDYNLGSIYAEELCRLADIDKHTPAKEVDRKTLREGIQKLESLEKKVTVVNGTIYPYELSTVEGETREYYDSLNEAFDEIYAKKELKKEKSSEKRKLEKKIGKYERIASSQKNAIKGFEDAITTNKRIGDLIYLHYQEIETILDAIAKARENNHSWEEIREKAKENKYIDDLTPKKLTLTFEKTFIIDLTKTIPENAEIYYEQSKKAKEKLEGAKKALKNTKKKIKSLKEGEILEKEVEVKKRRKREWYEKFRWCFSSDNHLILGGKDTKTNEMLVKNYMESTDLYLHADIHGAPHVIIKDGQEASENTVDEAAIFAVSFSKGWKEKIAGLDVYWVYPEQVTKSPPAGEYLPTGAFFIEGEKNFLTKMPLSLAIGKYKDKVMCGPPSAVKKHCENYVEISQGGKRKEALAKQISEAIDHHNLDEIIQVLPSGRSRIKKKS